MSGTSKNEVVKVRDTDITREMDSFATEEPLQIILSVPRAIPAILQRNISITMRTPGDDEHLAVGFLYTEGIIRPKTSIRQVITGENKVHVIIEDDEDIDLSKLQRHFYTSSSCGVCGKASIEAIKQECLIDTSRPSWQCAPDTLKQLPDRLRQSQDVFDDTGGIHAAGIFDPEGHLISLNEDVGRHNAVDKVIGKAFLDNSLPLERHILLLSGRASFELIQKAAMAGLQFVAAVGAPSSLAVALAKEWDMTLVGFLKANRFNIYHGEKRIDL